MPEKEEEAGIFSLLTLAYLQWIFLLRTRVKEGYVHTIARVLTLGGLIKRKQIH